MSTRYVIDIQYKRRFSPSYDLCPIRTVGYFKYNYLFNNIKKRLKSSKNSPFVEPFAFTIVVL